MTNKVLRGAKIKEHKIVIDLDGNQRHIFREDYGPNVISDYREYDMSDVPIAKEFGNLIYCKYCSKSVCPKTNYDGSLIVCPICYSGLIPLYDKKHHPSSESYLKWKTKYRARFPNIPLP